MEHHNQGSFYGRVSLGSWFWRDESHGSEWHGGQGAHILNCKQSENWQGFYSLPHPTPLSAMLPPARLHHLTSPDNSTTIRGHASFRSPHLSTRCLYYPTNHALNVVEGGWDGVGKHLLALGWLTLLLWAVALSQHDAVLPLWLQGAQTPQPSPQDTVGECCLCSPAKTTSTDSRCIM